MRSIGILGGALLAALLFGAAMAASASADEYLFNGKPITERLTLGGLGELELIDMKEGVAVKCTGHSEGTKGPGALLEITKVTGLAGELNVPCTVEKGSSLCESATAMAVNLPWHSELILREGELRGLITTSNAGWEVNCETIIGKVTDTCTGTGSAALKNVSGGVEVIAEEKSGKANCSRGGAEAGLVRGHGLIEREGLSVS